MIRLTEEEIAALSSHQAEESLLYVRYLLIREQQEHEIERYYQYIGLLEDRLAEIKANSSGLAPKNGQDLHA